MRIGCICLGGHLRALEHGSGLHEAVHNARLLDVHHVGQKFDAAVVVEVDGTSLVADVAGVAPESVTEIFGARISLALRPARAMCAGEWSERRYFSEQKIAELYAERAAPEPPAPERLVELEGIARSAIEASVGLADGMEAA